jgi:DNA mismatch endonuclease (patch repair protein)
MRGNRGKNTYPELKLRKALREAGLSGYRLHWNQVPGRPDISYPGRRIAIFVNGCYWHRCPKCNLRLPQSNRAFWKKKFQRNKERDKARKRELITAGWTVVVIWECEIAKDIESCIDRIQHSIGRRCQGKMERKV